MPLVFYPPVISMYMYARNTTAKNIVGDFMNFVLYMDIRYPVDRKQVALTKSRIALAKVLTWNGHR